MEWHSNKFKTLISQNNPKITDWNVNKNHLFDEYNHVINVTNSGVFTGMVLKKKIALLFLLFKQL